MNWRLRTFLFAVLSACPLSAAEDSGVVIHRGPVITTPKLGVLPTSEANVPAGELRVRREFRLSRVDFDKLATEYHSPSHEEQNTPVSAVEAIELAGESIELGDGPRSLVATELKLLFGPTPKPGERSPLVKFYLIGFIANGSEVYRAVLMDGKVLKPETVLLKE